MCVGTAGGMRPKNKENNIDELKSIIEKNKH